MATSTYVLLFFVCAAWFACGYLWAWLDRARRERGCATPPAFTLTSRPTGTNAAAPTAADSSSTFLLGDPLAGQVWPVTLREPSSFGGLTGYGSFEGGNRGNGRLPYAGCDD